MSVYNILQDFFLYFLISLFFCDCLSFEKRHFRLWTDFQCKNNRLEATKTLYTVTTLSHCATECRKYIHLCNGFSHLGSVCYLYQHPRASYLRDCEEFKDISRFYILKEYSVSDVDYYPVQETSLFHPVEMSSTYTWKNDSTKLYAYGNLSVDGNSIVKDFIEDNVLQCSATEDENFPWWRVDLLDVFRVVEVTIFKTEKNFLSELHNLEIRVGMTDIANLNETIRFQKFTKNDLCLKVRNKIVSQDNIHYLVCNSPVVGRFVSIQIFSQCGICGKGNYLTLCEVRVWAYPITTSAYVNRAYLQPTEGSNIIYYPCRGCNHLETGFPHRATDGYFTQNAYLNISSTIPETPSPDLPWILVDLWLQYDVDRAVIINRYSGASDRLHDFEIRVGNTKITTEYNHKHFEINPLCYASPEKVLYHNRFFIDLPCVRTCTGRFATLQLVKECLAGSSGCPGTLASGTENLLNINELIIYGKRSFRDPVDKEIGLHKPTLQSTTHDSATADLAVINRFSHSEISEIPTCTKTKDDDRLPWWRVDLLDNYVVKAVAIYNQNQVYKSQLHDFEIRVGFSKIEHKFVYEMFTNNPLCAAISGDNNKLVQSGWNRFLCKNPLKGQFVSIQIMSVCRLKNCPAGAKNILSLCGVYIYGQSMMIQSTIENVALDQHTSQSSTWFSAVNSSLAVDNYWSFSFIENGFYRCTHTDADDPFPWWRVQLNSHTLVLSVSIFNSAIKDKRSREFEIRVGFKDISSVGKGEIFMGNELCAVPHEEFVNIGWAHFTCLKPRVGQFVSIQIVKNTCSESICFNDGKNILSLCEVQVWGNRKYKETHPTEVNVGLQQPSYSSSRDRNSDPGFANNGVYDYSFIKQSNIRVGLSQTDDSDKKFPWWCVDLGGTYKVQAVAITDFYGDERIVSDNKDHLHDIQISMGKDECSKNPKDKTFTGNSVCANEFKLNAGRNYIPCKMPTGGRYVSVQITKCDPSDCSQSKNILYPIEIEVISLSPTSREEDELKKHIDEGNIALFKNAAQSSYFSSPYYPIDGRKRTTPLNKQMAKFCAITQKEDYPWWRIDLGQIFMVEKIGIDLKVTVALPVLSSIVEVRVGCTDILDLSSREKITANLICTNRDLKRSPSKTITHMFECNPPRKGRYISVQFMGSCTKETRKDGCWLVPTRLIICEFVAFGKLVDDYYMKLNETFRAD